jgi:hypothetical protein
MVSVARDADLKYADNTVPSSISVKALLRGSRPCSASKCGTCCDRFLFSSLPQLTQIAHAYPLTGDSQKNVLIQERLLGEAHGMDMNDLNGNYVCTFIKRKIRMHAGQTDQAVSVRDDRLEMIAK